MKRSIWVILSLVLVITSCKKEERDQSEIDRERIEQYLAENNLTAEVHPSGIYYIIHVSGTGDRPTINDEVEVKYKGYFFDGSVFDQTADNATATFPLLNLIEGWKIAIPLLREGGKGTFWIPSGLAYGTNPPPGIPRNEPLIFDIELLNVY